jgi:hypothetical protein
MAITVGDDDDNVFGNQATKSRFHHQTWWKNVFFNHRKM